MHTSSTPLLHAVGAELFMLTLELHSNETHTAFQLPTSQDARHSLGLSKVKDPSGNYSSPH